MVNWMDMDMMNNASERIRRLFSLIILVLLMFDGILACFGKRTGDELLALGITWIPVMCANAIAICLAFCLRGRILFRGSKIYIIYWLMYFSCFIICLIWMDMILNRTMNIGFSILASNWCFYILFIILYAVAINIPMSGIKSIFCTVMLQVPVVVLILWELYRHIWRLGLMSLLL